MLILIFQINDDNDEWFHIDPPATSEKIYFASKDPTMEEILFKNKHIADNEEESIQV